MIVREIFFSFSILHLLLFLGLLYLYFRNNKVVDFLYASIFVLCGFVFFFGQHQLLHAYGPKGAVFWNKFQYLGIFGLLYSFPLFTSIVTRRYLKNSTKYSLGILTAVIFIIIIFSNLIITNQHSLATEMIQADKGILYPFFIVILSFVCIYFSVQLIIASRRASAETLNYAPVIVGIFIAMLCGIADLFGLILINRHVFQALPVPLMTFGLFIITVSFAWTFLSQYSIIFSSLTESQVRVDELVAKSQKDYKEFINLIAKTIDAKDHYTAGHALRVMQYSIKIADALHLDETEIELLKQAALLHDIGKIGIPDGILNKKGRLSNKERQHIYRHPVVAKQILSTVSDFRGILEIIYHHHERVDGKGYPDGVSKDEIPLLSRILAVADAYDAMRSERPYRKAKSKEAAILELKKVKGSQLDERIVEKFIKVIHS